MEISGQTLAEALLSAGGLRVSSRRLAQRVSTELAQPLLLRHLICLEQSPVFLDNEKECVSLMTLVQDIWQHAVLKREYNQLLLYNKEAPGASVSQDFYEVGATAHLTSSTMTIPTSTTTGMATRIYTCYHYEDSYEDDDDDEDY